MTERINYLVVGLKEDIREDDIEHIVNALRMVKGVLSVQPNEANFESVLAEQRAKEQIRIELWEKFKDLVRP